jgi:hypothetical protein
MARGEEWSGISLGIHHKPLWGRFLRDAAPMIELMRGGTSASRYSPILGTCLPVLGKKRQALLRNWTTTIRANRLTPTFRLEFLPKC